MAQRTLSINSHRTTLIYNPVAGRLRGRGHGRLERAERLLADAGYAVSMTPTTSPGAAGEIARRAIEQGAELIVAAGGDGTLNEVVGGMVHSSVPLGILPAGTANVLATELGLAIDLEKSVRQLSTCVAQRVGVGRLILGTSSGGTASRHFLSMAGAGFDAHIVYGLSARLKARLGKGAYWIGGLGQALRRFPEFEVEIGGEREVCSYALVSRVRNYGGDFEIARHTTLYDDQFEVILFRGRHSLPYLKYVCGMITGRLAGMRGVTFLRADNLRIADPEGRPVHVQIDGEYAGMLPATIELVPDALTLLFPPEYIRLQSTSPMAAGALALE